MTEENWRDYEEYKEAKRKEYLSWGERIEDKKEEKEEKNNGCLIILITVIVFLGTLLFLLFSCQIFSCQTESKDNINLTEKERIQQGKELYERLEKLNN